MTEIFYENPKFEELEIERMRPFWKQISYGPKVNPDGECGVRRINIETKKRWVRFEKQIIMWIQIFTVCET